MTEQEIKEMIEIATSRIIDNRDYLTEEEMKQIVWIVAQILGNTNQEPT